MNDLPVSLLDTRLRKPFRRRRENSRETKRCRAYFIGHDVFCMYVCFVRAGRVFVYTYRLMCARVFRGRYYIIISHGPISSGLFYFINLIYNQTNSRLIFINKGVVNFLPSLM